MHLTKTNRTLSSAIGIICLACARLSAQETTAPTATRLPPVTVREERLKEEERVGDYQQPVWTTRRRFPTTRVYIQQQPWEVAVEQWWRGRALRGGGWSHLFQEEIEIGLPHRFQVDLYENWVSDKDGKMRHDNVAAEVRWAFADWGVIPLNPTLYLEWKFVDESADVGEFKLLLGEELAPRWHWGFNAIYEQEAGGARATEWAASQAISYTALDDKLSVGAEMKFVHESEQGSRSAAEVKVLIGPSVQWLPTKRLRVDFVPLFGVTDDSPHVEAFAVVSFELGRLEERAGIRAPSSLKSN